MRGPPHVAENFKIEIFEAGFSRFALTPLPATPLTSPKKGVPDLNTLQAALRGATPSINSPVF